MPAGASISSASAACSPPPSMCTTPAPCSGRIMVLLDGSGGTFADRAARHFTRRRRDPGLLLRALFARRPSRPPEYRGRPRRDGRRRDGQPGLAAGSSLTRHLLLVGTDTSGAVPARSSRSITHRPGAGCADPRPGRPGGAQPASTESEDFSSKAFGAYWTEADRSAHGRLFVGHGSTAGYDDARALAALKDAGAVRSDPTEQRRLLIWASPWPIPRARGL